MQKDTINILELQTKAFVTDLLTGVNTGDSIPKIMNYLLEGIGQFTKATRTGLYVSEQFNKDVEKIYQWKEDFSFSEKEIKQIPKKLIGIGLEVIRKNELYVMEDRETIQDKMPSEYEFYCSANVNSLLVIPVSFHGIVFAGIFIVNPDFGHFAVIDDSLKYLGRQVGILYNREKIQQRYTLFMEGMRSSNLSEFIVDLENGHYEAFRITKVLKEFIPEEGEWEWLRIFYASIIKPEYREMLLKRTEPNAIKSFLSTEKSTYSIDIERDVNGTNMWFRLEFATISLNEFGQPERFGLLVKDITQMKLDEEEYQQMLRALSGIYNATAMIDMKSKMMHPIDFSKNAKSVFKNNDLLDANILDVFCERMVKTEYENVIREFMNLDTLEERLKDKKVLSCDYEGKIIGWGRIILAPAKRNEDGHLEKVVFAVQDISKQKRLEEEMQYEIEHDALTRTQNRFAFNRLMKSLETSDVPFAFLLLDIDKFKDINDSFGHDVGDEVLVRLASILNKNVRYADELFRLGGDEFAIIFQQVTTSDAALIKGIINSVNNESMNPTDGKPAFTISAGVTFSTTGYSEKMYHNADLALYHTKKTTRVGCTVFEEIDGKDEL